MRSATLRAIPVETGGVLVGHQLGRNSAIATHLIDAGSRCIATPSSFEPDYGHQQSEFDRLYLVDKELTYLGDWHSHPGGASRPSRTDREMLEGISRSSSKAEAGPYMLIVGGRNMEDLNAFALSGRGAVQRAKLRLIGG